MTDTTGNGMMPPQGQAPAMMNVLAQYVKDLSFENPNAPGVLMRQPGQPQLNMDVNVNARELGQGDYEVELTLEAKAVSDNQTLFVAEVVYAGILRIQGVPEQQVHPVVMIEGPRLLFPFARQIIAEATRNGGYPPLMIDPIDFVALYQQRMGNATGGRFEAAPPAGTA